LCCSGFFVSMLGVMLKPVKRVPVFIAGGVIALVCLLRLLQVTPIEHAQRHPEAGLGTRFRDWLELDFFERLERITYDMRVREALKFAPNVVPNLGFAYIDDESIKVVHDGSLGYRFGLYWPRQIYGRIVRELSDQGAKAIAFDVMFPDLRPDHAPVQMADGKFPDSDEFFASQMRQASNVVLAVAKGLVPPPLFRTNALTMGDIGTEKDAPDGILRRVRAFRDYRLWHWAFEQVAADPGYGVDLANAQVKSGAVILPRSNGEEIKIPLDKDGNFDLADIGEVPAGVTRWAKPFTNVRIWHMGVVLAAIELGLDLKKSQVDLERGRIRLHGAPGVERVIPVDGDGHFYIDWCLPEDSPSLTKEPVQNLLRENLARLEGGAELANRWRGKLVIVGSTATGNDLTDRGATPLGPNTVLVSKHWNVANSIIMNRFVRRTPIGVDLALIMVLGIIAAALTWELRVLSASVFVGLLVVVYIALTIWCYMQARLWLPLILPIGGALVTTHVSLVTWRVVFEQAERRRVRSIFAKMVSPKIVNELLAAETFSLGGARREITVMFADVRGFTELTDTSQARVDDFVREHNLSGAAAERFYDEQAREMLSTVNVYLSLIADVIRKHDGTLDKFIGDCVMAFWGAPVPNPNHAVACVRAAIEAQRGIAALNQERAAQNHQRELENSRLIASSQEPLQMFPQLQLGTGINTGPATAGLMGVLSAESADREQLNYTVFGREVNLASRLETASGRGHIFISEATYSHLLRDDPDLAATCLALEPVKAKGFRTAIKVYEVPWHPADLAVATPQDASGASAGAIPSLPTVGQTASRSGLT
jgi:class 3 adenylate cyclase/CHASE2 domain-containing sensor protein